MEVTLNYTFRTAFPVVCIKRARSHLYNIPHHGRLHQNETDRDLQNQLVDIQKDMCDDAKYRN